MHPSLHHSTISSFLHTFVGSAPSDNSSFINYTNAKGKQGRTTSGADPTPAPSLVSLGSLHPLHHPKKHAPIHKHTSIPIRSLSVLETTIVWRLSLSHLFPLFHLGYLILPRFTLIPSIPLDLPRFPLICPDLPRFPLIPLDFPLIPLDLP